MNQIAITPFRQQTSYSCTAAVFQVIADFFGCDIDHTEAIKLTKCDKDDGSYLSDVAHLVKKLFRARYKTLKSIYAVEKYLDKNGIIMAGDDCTYIYNHAILIVGYDKYNWSVFDPNTGKINLKSKNHVFKHSDEFIVLYK